MALKIFLLPMVVLMIDTILGDFGQFSRLNLENFRLLFVLENLRKRLKVCPSYFSAKTEKRGQLTGDGGFETSRHIIYH